MPRSPNPADTTLTCDIAIIGGSLGGVAAALAALGQGCTVILTEETDWLGGQMTSQGVSALDEHPHIETFGGTRRYDELRRRIRQHYMDRYGAPAFMPNGDPLNPGSGWVSRLCFEPKVGLEVIGEMLGGYLESGQLRILYHHKPIAATVENDAVRDVTLRGPETDVRVSASYILDATDSGDLLPLTGTAYVAGAESQADTGEPSAQPDGARPNEVQSFTYSFAVEFRPGENHTIPKPEGYQTFRDTQPYSLTLDADSDSPKTFKMFSGELPFWAYRRIFSADLLKDETQPNDIALINWASNDYYGANLLGQPEHEQARIQDEAKRLSLGFLYWLQTEVPRDEGGFGYSELKLRNDIMGTADGLSKAPYIRESRRISSLERLLEHHITPSPEQGARAHPFPNSFGIGWYAMDLHPCVGNPHARQYAPTLPFQIPLGALISKCTLNLLPACKNLGTTHLTNGAARVHPTEWAVGEAAGALAAFCLEASQTPRQVWADTALTQQFQTRLLRAGVPLAWTLDVPPSHPLFVPVQQLVLAGLVAPGTRWAQGLELNLHTPLSEAERVAAVSAYRRWTGKAPGPFITLEEVGQRLSEEAGGASTGARAP